VTGEVNAYGSVALLLLMLGLPLVLSGVFQVWNRVNDRALAINDLKQEVAMEFACKVIPRVLLGEGIVCAALIMLPRWSALYDVWFGSEPRVGVNVATTSAFLILFSGFVLRTHLISRVLNTSSSSLVSARAQQYARLVTSSTNMVIAVLANIAFYMGLITEDPQNDLFVTKLVLIAMTMNLVFLSNTPAQSRKHSTAN